jgi:hypothetical protein
MKNSVILPSKENLERFDFADSYRKIIVLIEITIAIGLLVNAYPVDKNTRSG